MAVRTAGIKPGTLGFNNGDCDQGYIMYEGEVTSFNEKKDQP
jgi:hypothetical protein